MPRDAIDDYHVVGNLSVDIGHVSPAEDAEDDDADLSETCSNFSTVSEDSLPLIRAYSHTYHGSGQLMTPNDDSEARRMALQHELFQLCLDGGLVDAKLPLENHTPDNPFQILDVGAGSGIWARDMAQRHPQVNILGIDITRALLPNDVPANVTFEIADVMDPWPPHTYDFIHMRNLVGGGIRDWQSLLARAYTHLKPGGQLEFTEVRPRFFDVDPEQADHSSILAGAKPAIGAACCEYETAYVDMCMKLGLDFDPVPRIPGWLSTMGAESTRERVDWLPVSSWGNDPISRKKGEILSKMIECGLENWTLMLFGLCGWEEKDTRALLARVLKEVQDPELRSNVKVTFITARKPLNAPEPSAEVDEAIKAADAAAGNSEPPPKATAEAAPNSGHAD
ncbi:S-adenosyl-L-methionine-dependent methyltransferase [Ilyonectria destructans]|nr:S-adenosyl-L-methionine-dependent methyltransferase [Ilyonectria destructans]